MSTPAPNPYPFTEPYLARALSLGVVPAVLDTLGQLIPAEADHPLAQALGQDDTLQALAQALAVGETGTASSAEIKPNHGCGEPIFQTAESGITLAVFPPQAHGSGRLCLVMPHAAWTRSSAGQTYLTTLETLGQRPPAQGFTEPGDASRTAHMLSWLHDAQGEEGRQRQDVKHMSRELAASYEELSLMHKFAAGMSGAESPQALLHEFCEDLQQALNVRWAAVAMEPDEALGSLSGVCCHAGLDEVSAKHVSSLANRLRGLYPKQDRPVILSDAGRWCDPSEPSLAKQLIVAPLSGKRRLGLFLGGDKLDHEPVNSIESKLCASLAANLTVYLDNAVLIEETQHGFHGTLHALSAAIDAKDAYTHGHSERVAVMARQLSLEAGLGDSFAQRAYLCGLVHDVGKIGVPEHVLTKPGKLTDEEFQIIQQHPVIGQRILEGIRAMQLLIPGVRSHHERWDGRGYPDGLAGESIPLLGRVLAVVDSIDAMCSHRTYRRAMTAQQVRHEIERCRGTQYDPELAKAAAKLTLHTQWGSTDFSIQPPRPRRSA